MFWVSLFFIISSFASVNEASECQDSLDQNSVAYSKGLPIFTPIVFLDIDFSYSARLHLQSRYQNSRAPLVTHKYKSVELSLRSPIIEVDGKTLNCAIERELCKSAITDVKSWLTSAGTNHFGSVENKQTNLRYIDCAKKSIAQFETFFETRPVQFNSDSPTTHRAF
jgi:hypothetical protein